MSSISHWAIFTNNTSNKKACIAMLLSGQPDATFQIRKGAHIVLFSKQTIAQFIEKEERHHIKKMPTERTQSIRSLSSGEQKKALLKHLLSLEPDVLILDNPFDNLDTETQAQLKNQLVALAQKISLLQFVSRTSDCLSFIHTFFLLDAATLIPIPKPPAVYETTPIVTQFLSHTIPSNPNKIEATHTTLVHFKNVAVHYQDKPVLHQINWEIKAGEFWQLLGKNGSGKTTLLTMIIGDNPKAYGQELYLFGRKKGSGESVWEVKKKIGYMSPAMTDRFRGYHTALQMLISGLYDSIGLYTTPSDADIRLAKQWLTLLKMDALVHTYFQELTMGQQRMLMIVRAFIKQPLLLILDEPTAGLDDVSAALVVALVNKLAAESNSAIIFVSHRKEKGLQPDNSYALTMTTKGSTGSTTN